AAPRLARSDRIGRIQYLVDRVEFGRTHDQVIVGPPILAGNGAIGRAGHGAPARHGSGGRGAAASRSLRSQCLDIVLVLPVDERRAMGFLFDQFLAFEELIEWTRLEHSAVAEPQRNLVRTEIEWSVAKVHHEDSDR